MVVVRQVKMLLRSGVCAQELPWRRIDVCFKGTSMPFFAHNLIQVNLGQHILAWQSGSSLVPICWFF